jgi:hypothetical protein
MRLIDKFKTVLANLPGFYTNQKYIIFESDDWGSIRMSSLNSFNRLLKQGIRVDNCPYNLYDSLESENDLEALGNTLSKFKDVFGNSPIFSANSILTNPNFEKIREDHFTKYSYELSTSSYKRFNNTNNSFNLLNQLIQNNLFSIQFHGREHLHVPYWLEELQDSKSPYRTSFDYGVYGLGKLVFPNSKYNIQENLNIRKNDDFIYQKNSLEQGVKIFEKIYGCHPKTFIAPNYVWSSKHESILSDCNIIGIQGMKYQFVKDLDSFKKRFHFSGERNILNQTYIVRNCFFEPSIFPKIDSVDYCLNQISIAFSLNKPAIISTHRVNFIGNLHPENSIKNLSLLSTLIAKILQKWPNIRFISSLDLVLMINQNLYGN